MRGNPLRIALALAAAWLAIGFGFGFDQARTFARTQDPTQNQAQAPAAKKKIVIIAGKKSHGPEGNGIHDYGWSAKLIKVMLDHSNVRDSVAVEYRLNGWPSDPGVLDAADAIMVISDGRDGDLYEEAPHFASDANAQVIAKQIARGCGFLTFHFSTFAPDKYADQILDWSGGYFDWETDGKRQWHSAIQTLDADVRVATPSHPISRGLTPFRMKEEFYYNIRFQPEDPGLKPIWSVPALNGREPDGRWVAWAKERANGGRGFGTTCGHFYDNWKHEPFRKMVLNAIVWAARLDVPAQGVEAKFHSREEIEAALRGVTGSERAKLDDQPIRALILAGNEAHKWHNWEKTTTAIKSALERDPRVKVEVAFDIEELAKRDLSRYHVIVQNYVNWQDPKPLSEASRTAFVQYLNRGGGLILPHFAGGAYHFSLPEAGASDWPEYRKMVRRVWNHHGKSGHDAFGLFQVRPTAVKHSITEGLGPFEIHDELYFRQEGPEPVEPLIAARSKATGQDEPLAWAYSYGAGRVFQTLIGHSERTYDVFEPREMLRRAAAWAANRKPWPIARENDVVATAKPAGEPLVAGKFGKALNAKASPLIMSGKPAYRRPPLTVDCWAKLSSKSGFNILVASETKASPTHWELFTFAGSGQIAAYLPGMTPDHARGSIDVCDGQWHHLAMTYQPDRVRLYVDGKLAADQKMTFRGGSPTDQGLAVGGLVEGGIGCDGLIDEVRVRRGVHEIQVPDRGLEADPDAAGLWRMDDLKDIQPFLRSGPNPNPSASAVPAAPPYNPHFGKEEVGFDWTEQDSVDDRWGRTEIGRFLASNVPLPGGAGTVRKGLSIRVGDRQEATVCYDTEHCGLRASWDGGFLKFNPARYGIISPPLPNGRMTIARPARSDWRGQAPARYRGLQTRGDRVIIEWEIDGAIVRESPWVERLGSSPVFVRSLEFEPSAQTIAMKLIGSAAPIGGERWVGARTGDQITVAALLGDSPGSPTADRDGFAFAPSTVRREARLAHWTGPAGELDAFLDWAKGQSSSAPWESWRGRVGGRWTADIRTRGVRAADDGPYVVDTLTLPFENPYRALLFCSGLDFFRNGDIAVCTVHGDVWRVAGANDDLGELRWSRYATGLFQPLGLKIIDDHVYVLGRDQITKLRDRNGDGEADDYENFCNLYETSDGGHDYVTCLETDAQGLFYLAHAKQGLVRISRDGKQFETIATGLRNPNGLSVGPGDVITVSPQEGEWSPASSILQVRDGDHYGFKGPKVALERPLGYDPPLCWLPRMQDNSSGGQAWVTSDRWGPLRGQLLHFSFGQCRLMLTIRETIAGRSQGATVAFPLNFDSGIMRGRFHPIDGQLYVAGLKGWVSSAVRDGCLQRVRFTGRPADLPIGMESKRNGLLIRFSEPLDKEWAEDPDRYSVQRWNYRYSGNYGSPDLSVSQPSREGRDEVEVVSATLMEQGRAVFLELGSFGPAMQYAASCRIRSAQGHRPIALTLYPTIHATADQAIEPRLLTRRPRPGRLDDAAQAALRPGAIARFESRDRARSDAIVARMAAWSVEPGESSTIRLGPGPFRSRFRGYLQAPLPGRHAFAFEGTGKARLTINGRDVWSGEGDLSRTPPASVDLHKGHNVFAIDYESSGSARDAARWRWLWRGDDFDWEPVPPTALHHDGRDPELSAAEPAHRGLELIETRHCARCHDLSALTDSHALTPAPPDLIASGDRLQTRWLAHWLLNPRKLRPDATMPHLFRDDSAADRRQAADLAAYLATLREPHAGPDPEPNREAARGEGSIVFEDLGCIACHRLDSPQAADRWDRISLAGVGRKYEGTALKRFLRKPRAHHQWTKMPDFRLSETEAAVLAAWLLEQGSPEALPDVPELRQADAQRGEALFREKRCADCHASDRSPQGLNPQAKRNLGLAHPDRGCLTTDPARASAGANASPNFGLSPRDVQAIREALALLSATTIKPALAKAERAERWMDRLRCASCHNRDQRVSPRSEILADESESGRVAESLPSLTWTGEKLRTEWTEALLAGRFAKPIRPDLKARMPAFPAWSDVIAAGLAAQHGALRREPDVPIDPESAKIGERLAAKNGGLDCRQCHAVGAMPANGDRQTQIAPGVNFAIAGQRLRYDYYRRFTIDPMRVEITTKMPKLSPDGKTTPVKDVFDGDARRQFDALWHYIRRP